MQKIAYKLGRDEYGLTQGDFVLKQWPVNRKFKIKVIAGSVIRLYFARGIMDPEFDSLIKRALRAVAYIKSKKFPPPVLWLPVAENGIPKFEIPPLVPWTELEVEQLYYVRVRHRSSGLVVVKHGTVKDTFTNLTRQARVEISDTLDTLDQLTPEGKSEMKEVLLG